MFFKPGEQYDSAGRRVLTQPEQWPWYQPVAHGWECPKCGRVYGPSQSHCPYHGPNRMIDFATNNTAGE